MVLLSTLHLVDIIEYMVIYTGVDWTVMYFTGVNAILQAKYSCLPILFCIFALFHFLPFFVEAQSDARRNSVINPEPLPKSDLNERKLFFAKFDD